MKDRTATQFVGDPDEVADSSTALQRVTGADELVITSVTHGHEDRLRSHELIAERWGTAMNIREGKHRKQIHLGRALSRGQQHDGVDRPGAGSQIEFDSFVHFAPHRRTRAVRLLLPRRGAAAARAPRPHRRPRRGRRARHLHRAGRAGRRSPTGSAWPGPSTRPSTNPSRWHGNSPPWTTSPTAGPAGTW